MDTDIAFKMSGLWPVEDSRPTYGGTSAIVTRIRLNSQGVQCQMDFL